MAQDAVSLIIDDHQRVESLFGRYEQSSDEQEKTEIAHDIVHELAVHGEIEELLLYPRVRKELPDGDELASHSTEEHVGIKQTLNDIDGMTAADAGFDDRVRELISEVRHHVEEEESDMLPRLREAMSAEDLESLGSSLDRARAAVPTRPHPHAPTSPAGKAVAAPGAALVDRVRDAMRSIGDERR